MIDPGRRRRKAGPALADGAAHARSVTGPEPHGPDCTRDDAGGSGVQALIAHRRRDSRNGKLGHIWCGLQSGTDKAKKAQRIVFPFTGLRLLLPAIVPSWRFFDAVTASPRVDYAMSATPEDMPGQWQEFRPRPDVLPPATILRRLFWNPQWNETLFLVSLAERLASAATAETEAHSARELLLRVARHLHRDGIGNGVGACLHLRLRFVSRAGRWDAISDQTAYVSGPHPMAELITP